MPMLIKLKLKLKPQSYWIEIGMRLNEIELKKNP